MKIQLKLIASYRDFLPPENGGRTEIEIPAGTTAVAILQDLGIPIDETVILVNGRTPDPDETLQEGSVVFAFQATAGG